MVSDCRGAIINNNTSRARIHERRVSMGRESAFNTLQKNNAKKNNVKSNIIYLFIYLFIHLFIYLFVFPGLVTLSILHTEKLHCCRNIRS